MATAFVDEWVARHGVPNVLHSERDAAFESTLLYEVFRKLGIQETRKTSYQPEDNRLVKGTHLITKTLCNR